MRQRFCMCLCSALACFLALAAASADIPAAASPAAAQTTQLNQRGKELRAAIDTEYKRLKGSRKLQRDNDVTRIVQKYLPAGTSFDDAEALLHGAGCQLGKSADGHRVVGRVILGGHFPSGVIFVVSLTPKSADDFTVVDTVLASIIVEYV
jgi:hypothetical protein